MKVGIIGGGMMGLSAAYFLSQQDCLVTIIEKEKELGGLSRSAEFYPGVRWDQYYHAILSTDKELLWLLKSIGLLQDLSFAETKTGFYSNGALYSMSSTWEFLAFKPLNIWDKFRLGAGIFYCSRLSKGKRLEKLFAKQWLIQIFGRRNYEKIWDPLLRSKFGEQRQKSSAALIWATIKRYYGTRKGSSKKELMGHVLGGYRTILGTLESSIRSKNGGFIKDSQVMGVKNTPDKKLQVTLNNGSSYIFDKVIATIPNPEIDALQLGATEEFHKQLQGVKYLGLVCLTLVLKQSLSPYYVINLTDSGLPFTGVIEVTNIISTDEVGGYSLIYLPRYVTSDDSYMRIGDQDVYEDFIPHLHQMFPTFDESQIIHWTVNKEKHVQPLLEVGYSEKVMGMQTELENFYILNSTMITDSNLNNNRVLKLAEEMSQSILSQNPNS